MQYICLKKLTVNGKDYVPGDKIPGKEFDEGRPGKLISYGYIAESEAKETTQKPVETSKKESTQTTAKSKKNAASNDTE